MPLPNVRSRLTKRQAYAVTPLQPPWASTPKNLNLNLNQRPHLRQQAAEKVLQLLGHRNVVGEAEGLCLHHLEELEHVGRIEGDTAVHKCEEAGAHCIHIRRSAPGTHRPCQILNLQEV